MRTLNYTTRILLTMHYVNENGIPNRVVTSYDTVFARDPFTEGGGESADIGHGSVSSLTHKMGVAVVSNRMRNYRYRFTIVYDIHTTFVLITLKIPYHKHYCIGNFPTFRLS